MDPTSRRLFVGTTVEIAPSSWLVIFPRGGAFGSVPLDLHVDSGQILVSGVYTASPFPILTYGGFIQSFSSSAVPNWYKDYGDITTQATGIAVDASGNIFVCGTYTSSGQNQMSLFKFNSAGTLVWQRLLGSTSYYDDFTSISLDSSGNIYVVGQSYGATYTDCVAVKYNTSGTIQWQQKFSTATNDSFTDCVVGTDNNLYAVGYSASSSANSLVMKINSATGAILWQSQITNVGSGNRVAVDSGNNIYLTNQDLVGTANFYLAKYNSTGTIQWARALGDVTTAYQTTGVCVDSSDDVYIAGVNASTQRTLYYIKYNSSGVLQWQRSVTITSTGGTGNGRILGGGSIKVLGTSLYIAGVIGGDDLASDTPFIMKVPTNSALSNTVNISDFTGWTTSLTFGTSSIAAPSAGTTTSAPGLTASAAGLTGSTPSPLIPFNTVQPFSTYTYNF